MRRIVIGLSSVVLMLCLAAPLYATNGDNLIGVGPVSRSMGGVGIASPQDAISAVFANPSAMCFAPYCPSSQFDFAGTLFMPKVKASVTNGANTASADSEENVYAIPAIGFSVPIESGPQSWRFGLSAYGVTGLGVDYRGTAIDDATIAGILPGVSGEYTSLQIMKFAPAVAFQPNSKWSVGAAVHVDYGILDLRSGSSAGYALGFQPGVTYTPTANWTFGAVYVTPQKITHKNISDFDQDGHLDDLDLESPQQLGLGAAYTFTPLHLQVEADLKWINWSNAAGYRDFDWSDQWVYALGAQYSATQNLKVRVGYNYAANPVKEHNGFTGYQLTSVQGKNMPRYYYETFRIIGFPAVAEQHITLGVGYQFGQNLILDLGYMYAFENTIRETGTNVIGQQSSLQSTLSESSIDFGLTWRF
ncbi:MAG: outer membrane protein transport protein [Desulfobacteraceae bacterium]|nr:outer membrane protein transport protein [Desulfobacteraceae bacterium]